MAFQHNLLLCRLCLSEKNTYADIYESNDKHGFHVVDAINELLELNVQPDDGLPGYVCHDCLSEVARFKSFKKVCHESKTTLESNRNQKGFEAKSIVKEEEKEEVEHFEVVDDELNLLGSLKIELHDKPPHRRNASCDRDGVYNQYQAKSIVKEEEEEEVEHFEVVDDELNLLGSLKIELHDEPPHRRNASCDRDGVYNQYQATSANVDSQVDNGVLRSEQLKSVTGGVANTVHSLFKCPTCSKVFPSDTKLRNHISIVCRPISHCTYCNITFSMKALFKQHMTKYHKEHLPYQCEVCKKAFIDTTRLRLHSACHSNDQPFSCKECGKHFKRKNSLRLHTSNFHSQWLPYCCNVCGKMFSTPSRLQSHIVIHSNDRPYVCKECGNRYKRKHKLKNHYLIFHTRNV